MQVKAPAPTSNRPFDLDAVNAHAAVRQAGLAASALISGIGNAEQLRQMLADRVLAESRARNLRGELVKLDQEADQATSDHQVVCQPLQNQLQEIDRDITAAMIAGQPHDSGLDMKRVQLRAEVERANKRLQSLIENIDERRGVIEREIGELLGLATQADMVRSRLVSQEVAGSKTWLAHYGQKRFGEFASRAVEGIQKILNGHLSELETAKRMEDSHLVHVMENRVARLQAEIDAIGSYAAMASKTCDELQKKMIYGDSCSRRE
jgi:chromosome segregation ATPase